MQYGQMVSYKILFDILYSDRLKKKSSYSKGFFLFYGYFAYHPFFYQKYDIFTELIGCFLSKYRIAIRTMFLYGQRRMKLLYAAWIAFYPKAGYDRYAEVRTTDCSRTGSLIYGLRKEKGLTQRQLAEQLHVSDKAISKWERGQGCPDISLLGELSKILGVNIEKLLLGELEANGTDGGNMKRVLFYTCPDCGNTITSTGPAELSCCGRKLVALVPQQCDTEHEFTIEMIENDFYITFSHEMTKEHYLTFLACVSWDRVLLVRLYPEQGGEVRIPRLPKAQIYIGCNQHGLWTKE